MHYFRISRYTHFIIAYECLSVFHVVSVKNRVVGTLQFKNKAYLSTVHNCTVKLNIYV